MLGHFAVKGMAALPPVRGTVVHDPEHSGSHEDLRDQTLERDDAGCGLATKNMGSTDIPSRHDRLPAAFVFVLDPHRPARRWRQKGVSAAASGCWSFRPSTARNRRRREAGPPRYPHTDPGCARLSRQTAGLSKIQLRWRQGRIASSDSHRQIVVSPIEAPAESPRPSDRPY